MAGMIRRGLCSLLLLILCGLTAYEGWRVWAAHRQLEAAFAPYRDGAGGVLQWRELTAWQQNALILIEDPAFFDHNGIDMTSAGAGVTSITQAIAKRLFFEDFRPGFAKIEQSLIARFVISPNVSKEEQLTAFLNVAYLGEHEGKEIVGFRMAAEAYFGKNLAALSEAEFLRLTGALLAPRSYPPIAGNTASDNRLARLERYVAGACAPASNGDVTLADC